MIEGFLSCNKPYEFQDFEQNHCTAYKLNQTGIATTKLIHKTNSATNAKFTIKKCCLVVIYKTLTQKVPLVLPLSTLLSQGWVVA